MRAAAPAGDEPLDRERQLPRPRNGLGHNVGFLDAAGKELVLGALDEWLDDRGVPAGVDDADAQGAAVVLLRGRALERHRVRLGGVWRAKRNGQNINC